MRALSTERGEDERVIPLSYTATPSEGERDPQSAEREVGGGARAALGWRFGTSDVEAAAWARRAISDAGRAPDAAANVPAQAVAKVLRDA